MLYDPGRGHRSPKCVKMANFKCFMLVINLTNHMVTWIMILQDKIWILTETFDTRLLSVSRLVTFKLMLFYLCKRILPLTRSRLRLAVTCVAYYVIWFLKCYLSLASNVDILSFCSKSHASLIIMWKDVSSWVPWLTVICDLIVFYRFNLWFVFKFYCCIVNIFCCLIFLSHKYLRVGCLLHLNSVERGY